MPSAWLQARHLACEPAPRVLSDRDPCVVPIRCFRLLGFHVPCVTRQPEIVAAVRPQALVRRTCNRYGRRMSVPREKLYEEVWAEPMTKVAERYGVSSSYLAQICSRLNVPRPSRGYWAQ